MRLIRKGDDIIFKTKKRVIEGTYQGKYTNGILVEAKNRKFRVPYDNISAISPARFVEPKSISEQISYYRNLLERNGTGDNYGMHLLANQPMTISVEAGVYDLYRLLLKLADPDQYTDPESQFSYSDSLMTFHNPSEYERVKKFLKSQNVNFKEIGDIEQYTDEEHEDNSVSPYPKNVHDD